MNPCSVECADHPEARNRRSSSCSRVLSSRMPYKRLYNVHGRMARSECVRFTEISQYPFRGDSFRRFESSPHRGFREHETLPLDTPLKPTPASNIALDIGYHRPVSPGGRIPCVSFELKITRELTPSPRMLSVIRTAALRRVSRTPSRKTCAHASARKTSSVGSK